VLVFCPTKDSARNLALQVSQSMSNDVNDVRTNLVSNFLKPFFRSI
jgi:hypothetical protein